jgi:hypothetical protein
LNLRTKYDVWAIVIATNDATLNTITELMSKNSRKHSTAKHKETNITKN